GPEATSPHDTIRSGFSSSTSRSTASSAGRLPWMSESAATRKLTLGVLHPPRLRFRRRVVRVRSVEPHAFGLSVLIELGADDVPPLAQVKHTVVQSGGPALRRDADAFAQAEISLRACVVGRRPRSGPARRTRRREPCPGSSAARSIRTGSNSRALPLRQRRGRARRPTASV